MKRRDVLERLQRAARARDLDFAVHELTNHTAVRVGNTSKTLGRHANINDVTVRQFWEEFSDELGKGWWRK